MQMHPVLLLTSAAVGLQCKPSKHTCSKHVQPSEWNCPKREKLSSNNVDILHQANWFCWTGCVMNCKRSLVKDPSGSCGFNIQRGDCSSRLEKTASWIGKPLMKFNIDQKFWVTQMHQWIMQNMTVASVLSEASLIGLNSQIFKAFP